MAPTNLHLIYSPAYNDTTVGYDTTRKADAIAQSLVERPIAGVDVFAPSLIDIELLKRIHDEDYIDAVLNGTPASLALSNGIGWSDDFFAAVLASTSGVCTAATAALAGHRAGSLSSGLHHARYETGRGNCTFNGLVVAAVHALEQGAERVLIVDFDAHCGGGTASLIVDRPGIEQIDVSVISYDSYQNQENARLWMACASNYIATINEALESVTGPGNVDLVLYNAGMDPHEHAGGVRRIDADMLQQRDEIVYDWASSHALPIAFVLAGGYTSSDMTIDELVDLHRITLTAAITSK
jgi:acetoin utilization deacetylase AcuC-like enzyme